jgi:hypothetical protein
MPMIRKATPPVGAGGPVLLVTSYPAPVLQLRMKWLLDAVS